jgi:serine/threonine-protein kinase
MVTIPRQVIRVRPADVPDVHLSHLSTAPALDGRAEAPPLLGIDPTAPHAPVDLVAATPKPQRAAMGLPVPESPAIEDASEVGKTGSSGSAAASARERRTNLIRKAAELVAVAVISTGVVLFFVRRPAVSDVQQPIETGTPATTGAPAEKRADSFVLMIESFPPGASVTQDGEVLGTTPLRLTIQNEAVRAKQRQLTVQKDGYQPYTIVQGPSEQSVRLPVTLAELPAAGASSGKSGRVRTPPARRAPFVKFD